MTTPEDLRDDIAALRAALAVERAKRLEEAARAARSRRNWRWSRPRPPTIKP
jgi:hypothetical protein